MCQLATFPLPLRIFHGGNHTLLNFLKLVGVLPVQGPPLPTESSFLSCCLSEGISVPTLKLNELLLAGCSFQSYCVRNLRME